MGDIQFEGLMKGHLMGEEMNIISVGHESYDENINGLKDLSLLEENQISKHNFGVERGNVRYLEDYISL